ncbi:TPA: hypothetical protein DEW05_02145 [Candidatus Saccharibacteria bacterium]|nr:hypothetical protein [Candidatus Saccharibacteria bacterium]
MFIQDLPLFIQIICWIGIWAGLGIASAVAWLVLGTLVSLFLGGFLPGEFWGRDGAKRAGWYFGLSAAFGPVSIVGIPLTLLDD